jgi:hypothetical protein
LLSVEPFTDSELSLESAQEALTLVRLCLEVALVKDLDPRPMSRLGARRPAGSFKAHRKAAPQPAKGPGAPTLSSPPVNVCIYCGSDGGKEGLTDEHTLPFALGGGRALRR